ncbi:hypothetical protein N7520_010935 [Penicillium odoratum]|uniref:uncharacterized protein n=1 Tax=Penicillium odoratum TaxID=1167516 RepID=UPI002547FE10|nr:uncharacterized protein N7520_010935 [Penicillium odoratum]KAJ5745753.1 hypothetical protein N7520_010935 [Penicillium odoratum]
MDSHSVTDTGCAGWTLATGGWRLTGNVTLICQTNASKFINLQAINSGIFEYFALRQMLQIVRQLAAND